MSVITKQNNNRIHTSTKLTPIQASSKKNEGHSYKNLLDKRKEIKPKYKIHDLVRVGDLRRTLSKGDTTNWSYELHEITEIINDTIPSYRLDDLPERYNESLLKKAELTLTGNKDIIKALNLK